MKHYLLVLLAAFSFTCYAQDKPEFLTKNEIEKDLAFLHQVLQRQSSYQGLNGYNYQGDFDKFVEKTNGQPITKYNFGLFLTKTVGKIGDRHSYIKNYELPDSLYFPIAFAPFRDKVLIVDYVAGKREYKVWNAEFPYLKAINDIPVEEITRQILPGEILAPKISYFTNAVREFRDIELVFRTLNLDLPNPISLVLTNEKGADKEIMVNLVVGKQKARIWDERFYNGAFSLREEQYNDTAIISRFFRLDNNIGYIQIADMIEKGNAPVFFDFLNKFMTRAERSKALIIDVRDNGGGTRDIIQELAGYFIHPDSIYVVNIARQRGTLPLTEGSKQGLHSRFLYAKNEMDSREQASIDQFMSSFTPMYDLESKKFSEYHYHILNGQKVTKGKYLYNKPIYILANERTFSAASILVSIFKGLPNIKIVGVNTDGSSGNSERFELPNSGFQGKISTMVSYQKNGKILDGIGTEPDIFIERSLEQIFLKEDYQLNKLLEVINQK
jgi:C-terminal processing protease CtpA/Prc